MKTNRLRWFLIGVLCVLIWDGITIAIQAFKCPKMTQTELFIHASKSMVLDFKDCD